MNKLDKLLELFVASSDVIRILRNELFNSDQTLINRSEVLTHNSV